MTFLNEYATSIIITSLLATLLEALIPPGKNQKYTRMLIGLFVMLAILKPLTMLPNFTVSFALPQSQTKVPQLTSYDYVTQAFEHSLAQNIQQDVQNHFGTEITCRVECSVNENHQITKIKKISLTPYHREIAQYIAEKYGIKEADINS